MSQLTLAAGQQADDFARHRAYTFSGVTKPLLEHPDGVYIGLPELDYLNDWALSYSAFKTINSSPPDWHWDSPFNQLEKKEQKDTAALRFGSALHAALLEPAGALEARFGVAPVPEDYPKAARTVTELKDEIKKFSQTPKGLKKDLIKQLLALDSDAQIFDVIKERWVKKGLVELSPGDMDKIKLMVALATKHPDLVMAFTGIGLSEVSVFWTDEQGIRQRARFDRMKPVASIDLKSFANWQGRNFKKALLREASIRQYHLQAAHYDEARRQARRLVQEGKVFVCSEQIFQIDEETGQYAWDPDAPTAGGQLLLTDQRPKDAKTAWFTFETDDDGIVHGRGRHLANGEQAAVTSIRAPSAEEMDLINQVLLPEAWEWVWIFYKTDGAPTAQPVRLRREVKAFSRGVEMRQEALTNFLHYQAIYGLESMWLRMDQMWDPDESEWPFFMGVDE